MDQLNIRQLKFWLVLEAAHLQVSQEEAEISFKTYNKIYANKINHWEVFTQIPVFVFGEEKLLHNSVKSNSDRKQKKYYSDPSA